MLYWFHLRTKERHFRHGTRFAAHLLRPLFPQLHRPSAERGHRAGGVLVQPQHPPLEARRDCLLAYAPTIGMEVRVQEDYGLKDFVRHVAGDIDHRCAYCYEHRLEGTAKYAAEHGFTAFTSTLLASTYQNHEAIAAAAEMYARQYGVEFLYRDFRSNFRAGNQRARELGFYMQKYCGCVFSEEDRYQKQILRDQKEPEKHILPS